MTAPAALRRRHVSSGSGPGNTRSPATRSLWKLATLGRREDGAQSVEVTVDVGDAEEEHDVGMRHSAPEDRVPRAAPALF